MFSGSFVPKIYDNDEDSCYRSPSDRDMDIQTSDLSCKTSDSLRGSPKSQNTRDNRDSRDTRDTRDSRDDKADGAGKPYEHSNPESDTSSVSNPDDERACKSKSKIRKTEGKITTSCCYSTRL